MVAYSFQPRFELPIILGTKCGTIRATGKRRHAAPGEVLQLYRGMRTKQCRLMAKAICFSNEPISISFEHFVVKLARADGTFERLVGIDDAGTRALLDPFAREDGFADFGEMAAFWRDTHGSGDFHGRHIKWLPSTLWVTA